MRLEILTHGQLVWRYDWKAWLSQELLTTFEQDLGEVALIPGDVGVFVIKVNESK